MVLNEYNNLVAKCYAGDLLDAHVDIIFHVTNCMGVMGAGIAKSIKNKWPKVFTEYKKQRVYKTMFTLCFLYIYLFEFLPKTKSFNSLSNLTLAANGVHCFFSLSVK